jgi:hypothetical protein
LWLGVDVQCVTDETANRLSVYPARGVLMVHVKGGGQDNREIADVVLVTNAAGIGRVVNLVVIRNG